ncbi:RND transporter [Alkalilimnicola ehrlichii]|uniref:RND transporter n=1 Tax=Alkalilimnicola ehrlichii TaxID=351052 RepID=A0A3E0X312_9GAMM|nr:efflux transporter outer membrane subunit [Alkalilimnicola ehrlichii]RFA28988.1 RND transporter [Alkalilimnicola ehrlichii]RFA38624.1 RND transporter [Alkalilimnicola ehrlichii]
MHKKLLLAVATSLAVAGCVTVGPDYQARDFDLPEQWPEHHLLDEADTTDWLEWWQRFEDPVLNQLVGRALDDNLEIRLQAARIEEARARLGLARAEQRPSLSAQAEASRDRQPAAAMPLEGFEPSPSNLFSISGMLSYELDLWGRLTREREAAEAILEENQFSREAVRLNVVADVVATYFNLRTAQSQLAITKQALETREETYRLERVRFEAGDADELSLRQAQSELATARAQLPAYIQQVRVLEGALGALLGLTPAELFREFELGDERLEQIALPEGVPSYLPSQLLERRPDIRAAEAGVIAATAGVGVAQASRLPRLNLTTLLGTAAVDTGDLFTGDAMTWGLGASVAGPLLDFGRGRARVDTAEAIRSQAELRYEATVNTAFREVRDALVVYETSGDRVAAIQEQVDAIGRSLYVAELRYREGLVGFIELLDAQRALLSAELALAEANRDRLTATATLFKALGGGWSETAAEDDA